MSLSKLNDNLNIIRSLANRPALEPDELKSEFDKAGNIIKSYINEILTEEIEKLVSESKIIIDNNLTSENSTHALGAVQGKILMELIKPVVLFNNETGSKEDIQLAEDSSNFKRVKIDFYYNNIYSSVTIDSPNGKTVSLSVSFSINQYNATRTQYKTIRFEGDTLKNRTFGYSTISTNNVVDADIEENEIYITKITGWR